jgi:hypothetical protein
MSAIGNFITEIINGESSRQLLTLFIISIICMIYIYDKHKDTYVYISMTFVYLSLLMVLLITQNEFPRPIIFAMIIPVILNIVGMMLAYKARDEEDEDMDTMKSLIITCFVMISLIILLGTANLSMKLIYFTLVVLYILSSFVVYYANNSFLKNERATG